MMTTFFVYGTLKRGCWNHERFCRSVLSVEDAVVRGRLYEMPSGIPVLQVPEEDILARGTADPLADVAAQARFAKYLASILDPVPESATAGGWAPVYGELLIFDDPESRLAAIDRLEGFHPGDSSLYRRVLVPVYILLGKSSWLGCTSVHLTVLVADSCLPADGLHDLQVSLQRKIPLLFLLRMI